MLQGFFEPSLPVNPEYFVGRNAEIERFRNGVERGRASGRTVSFAILGDWGIGKSSLLLKYLSLLKKEYKNTTVGIDFTVTEDLSNYYTFCQALLDRFQLLLMQGHFPLPQRVKDKVRKWRLAKVELFGISAEKSKQYFLSSGTSLLQHNFREIWSNFLLPSKIKQVVIFLDDLHLLSSGERSHILSLRSLFQSLVVEGYNYSLAFSANRDFFGRIRDLAEPAIRFFEKIYLNEFTEKEVELLFTKDLELANIEVEIAPNVIEKIYHLTKGHPYFVSFVGRCLLDLTKEKKIDINAFNRLWPNIFDSISLAKFQEDISHINGRQMELLREIASVNKEIIIPSDLKGKYQPVYFVRAVNKGVLKKIKRGEYSLYHPLFKEYLKTTW